MPLADKLKDVPMGLRRRAEPLWKGPTSNDKQGGVTQSLLNRYLGCPERFRLHTIEGLRAGERFNHRLEYGNLWHTCEEWHAEGLSWTNVEAHLSTYADRLCKRYPFQREEIAKYYNACRVQFPEYVKYWSDHPDMRGRTPLFQEKPFAVHYVLPSARVAVLRGKWDGGDLVKEPRHGLRAWLQENKSKGEIDEQSLLSQLSFDLQNMFYLVALYSSDREDWGSNAKGVESAPIAGVRYNVVRRPFSSGVGNIKMLENVNRGKKGPDKKPLPPRPETEEEYYERLRQYFVNDPGHWFMRWNVEISEDEVKVFEETCLVPILENLCDDYEWWYNCKLGGVSPMDFEARAKYFPNHIKRHYRMPYGIYNPLAEGRASDLDDFLNTGNEFGLTVVDDLFPELSNV